MGDHHKAGQHRTLEDPFQKGQTAHTSLHGQTDGTSGPIPLSEIGCSQAERYSGLSSALTSCQLPQHVVATSRFKGMPNFIQGHLQEHLKLQSPAAAPAFCKADYCRFSATEMLVARLICFPACQKNTTP